MCRRGGCGRMSAPIALMAIPGVALTALVTGAVVHTALGLSWAVALLFGALIASTDPIAVVSLFRHLGVPRRLALLVEGESLFNDGASITLFQLILAAILMGEVQLGLGVLRFALAVVGAIAIGSVIGYGGSHLVRHVDNAQAQALATLIAAYGAYLVAEALGISGAIAVVMVGLFFGNYGATAGLSPRSVVALGATWEFLGFMANSLIFLLIGIELDPLTLARNWWVVAIAFLGALVGRAVAVYALLPWLRGQWAVPWRFRPVILWGGLRGAVSLALALSLPFTLPGGQPFPDRALLQILTFGVVAASLVGQGLTMPPLIRALGLASERARDGALEEAQARRHAVEAALLALAHERDRGEISSLHYERLANAYRLEQEQLAEQASRLEEERGDEQAQTPPQSV